MKRVQFVNFYNGEYPSNLALSIGRTYVIYLNNGVLTTVNDNGQMVSLLPEDVSYIEVADDHKIISDGGSTDYYKLPEGATELGDLIEYKRMNFNVGNIFKAAYRLGEKAGIDLTYDLNKIIFYAKRELAYQEKHKNG